MSLQNLSVPPAWRAGAAAAAAITAVAASATITTASDRLASCVIRLPSFLSDRDHLRTLERDVRACGRENADHCARTSGPEWARPCSYDGAVGCLLADDERSGVDGALVLGVAGRERRAEGVRRGLLGQLHVHGHVSARIGRAGRGLRS